MSSLNLVFGPKPPDDLEIVDIGFLSSPYLQPDSSLTVLGTNSFVPENKDSLQEDLAIFDEGVIGQTVPVTFEWESVTANGFYPADTSSLIQFNYTFDSASFTPNLINSQISIEGIRQTPANSWELLIKPGLVWRTYRYNSNEPYVSWVSKIPGITEGDNLLLMYSTPEIFFKPTESLEYLNTGLNIKHTKLSENVIVKDEITLSYSGSLDILNNLTINGTSISTTGLYFTNGNTDEWVKSIDFTKKEIQLNKAISLNSHVVIEYFSASHLINYSGFRGLSSLSSAYTWYNLDLNPEYGHYSKSDETDTQIESHQALLNQVVVYAIPTCVGKVIPEYDDDGSLSSIRVFFYRAANYNETHFIRHTMKSDTLRTFSAREGAGATGTWGVAVFGRNYYDEQVVNKDIYSFNYPSMMPLAKITLSAPLSANQVLRVDTRIRGGGVPEDFDFNVVDSNSEGLDKLRGFFDLSVWDGKAVKIGGMYQLSLPSSILKTDPNDVSTNKYTHDEIVEIVRKYTPPGTEFEIVYV